MEIRFFWMSFELKLIWTFENSGKIGWEESKGQRLTVSTWSLKLGEKLFLTSSKLMRNKLLVAQSLSMIKLRSLQY